MPAASTHAHLRISAVGHDPGAIRHSPAPFPTEAGTAMRVAV
jgi:hypothetical protein